MTFSSVFFFIIMNAVSQWDKGSGVGGNSKSFPDIWHAGANSIISGHLKHKTYFQFILETC